VAADEVVVDPAGDVPERSLRVSIGRRRLTLTAGTNGCGYTVD